MGVLRAGKLASALGSELRAYLADVRNVLGDLRSLLLKVGRVDRIIMTRS
jgi:hypothetical protein